MKKKATKTSKPATTISKKEHDRIVADLLDDVSDARDAAHWAAVKTHRALEETKALRAALRHTLKRLHDEIGDDE